MRRVLNVARRNKWIMENPFELGEPLISQEMRSLVSESCGVMRSRSYLLPVPASERT